jgi:hypothetical protein
MLDPSDPDACGQCHAGTPGAGARRDVLRARARRRAPRATRSRRALACNTCHGSGTRIYPPRDPLLLSRATRHRGSSRRSRPAVGGERVRHPCSTCHPTPGRPHVITGSTATGRRRHLRSGAVVGARGELRPGDRRVRGLLPRPGRPGLRAPWSDTTARLQQLPPLAPARTLPGACTDCHADANATGTALTGSLHMNGAWSWQRKRPVRRMPRNRREPLADHGGPPRPRESDDHRPVACASCHPVPSTITDPTHLDGVVQVTFTGLAVARGASPVWNGTSCTSVACHGANLADPAGCPSWTDHVRRCREVRRLPRHSLRRSTRRRRRATRATATAPRSPSTRKGCRRSRERPRCSTSTA